MKFSAVVPIQTDRQDSIKHNFILLNQKPLFSYIFETLLENPLIDRVVCYASNSIIKDFLPNKVEFIQRDRKLDDDNIRLKDMLESIAKDIISDYYILCSITSPFISNASILKGIESILEGESDCAFSVKKVNSFIWFDNKPLNFLPNNVLRTNEIKPIYIETKGFYIFSRQILQKQTYLGEKPKYIEVSNNEAINVKTQDDIEFANLISMNHQKINSKYFLLSKICNHIIFDMDGVLINSIDVMQKAWKESGGERYASFCAYKKYIGIPFEQICAKINVPKEQILHIKKQYFTLSKSYINEVKLYDEVIYTFAALQNSNIKISVVTSKNYHNAKNILDYFHLNVDCLVAPDSPLYKGRNKPFGDPLLFACVATHTQPNESIFIGDMLSDYQAAKNANIDFVFASYGYGEIDSNVNMIKNIKEILYVVS